MYSVIRSKSCGRSVTTVLLLSVLMFACSSSPRSKYPQATLLTRPPEEDASWLVWSPNGMYIAVSHWSSSLSVSKRHSAVYVFDLATGEYRLLLNDLDTTIAQSWSPDSEEILFFSAGGQYASGIWRARRDESEPPSFLADGTNAAWSGGGRIAVLSMGNQDIVLDVLESDPPWEATIFQGMGIGIDGLSWSPDGRMVALSADITEGGYDYNLFVTDLATRNLIQLTNVGTNHRPAWSPAQDLIAYEGALPNESEYSIFLTNSTGECVVRIPGSGGAHSPSWSPDGRRIAFIGLDGYIYALDLAQVMGDDFLSNGLVCPDT